MPRDLLASPAWNALSRQAQRFVNALMIEHADHGGEENGRLKCPYDILMERGMRRAAIKSAIHETQALGLVDADLGRRSHGARRLPSVYRLTWLGTPDGLMPTNEWKAIKNEEEACVRIENAMENLARERAVKAASRAARPNNREEKAA